MPAPRVVSIQPASGDKDVVLSYPITVTFDAPLDPASVTGATFACLGPGQTSLISPENLLDKAPSMVRSRQAVPGTFNFPSPNQFVFTPTTPFLPNCPYLVILAGTGAIVVHNTIKGADGTPLGSSFQSEFTTGVLAQSTLPPSAPLPWDNPAVAPWERPKIDPAEISVSPLRTQGNDLAQTVTLTFPGQIDPTSFALSDVVLAVEPLLNDPLLPLPANLSYTVQVSGNKLIIQVGNWPTPPAPAPAPPEIPEGVGWPQITPLRNYFED